MSEIPHLTAVHTPAAWGYEWFSSDTRHQLAFPHGGTPLFGVFRDRNWFTIPISNPDRFGTYPRDAKQAREWVDRFLTRHDDEGEPLVHIVSATAVVIADRTVQKAMCGANLGSYDEASRIHPVGNYLQTSGPYWDLVTCEMCRVEFSRRRS